MRARLHRSRIGAALAAWLRKRRSSPRNWPVRSSFSARTRSSFAGGGVIGGAIALELARAGLRVAVFDRQQPGQEASWASAGILSPAPESPGTIAIVPLGKASFALYPQFVAEVEEISGKCVVFRPKG